jgi:hypothetical protein
MQWMVFNGLVLCENHMFSFQLPSEISFTAASITYEGNGSGTWTSTEEFSFGRKT